MINVIKIFTIGFLLPFVISFLKLSKLSSEYDIRTIILVLGSFLSFYIGVKCYEKCSEKYEIFDFLINNKSKNRLNNNYKKISNKEIKSSSKTKNFKLKKVKIENKIINSISSIINFALESFTTNNVIIAIGIISFISFLIEVAVLRFVPILSFGTPHAYSTFHIFGIHYITTLYFLMPALSILNLDDGAHIVRPYDVRVSIRTRSKKVVKSNVRANFVSPSNVGVSLRARSYNKVNKVDLFINNKHIILIFSVVYAVVMSLLLVSRALLIMTVVVAGFAYIMRAHIVRPYSCVGAHIVRPYDVGVSLRARSKDLWVKKNIIPVIALISFIGLYISITVLRSHSVDYLNDIFEMKENTPIYITQPYMYLTQGFENLNYLITHNERFTFGRRTLAPLFSLLRTKKYFPLVTEAPFYQIKLELTSKPIIYDLYYDFSFIGTFIIMFIIGYLAKKIEIKNYKENNIYYNLFYCLICYYLLFSFFQSYLSLLDTWFYLIFTYLLYIISKLKKAKS